jgi:DNA-binding CsgD family transcriptional regulator
VPRPAARRFVGRTHELAQLSAVVDLAVSGTPGVAVVSGDAGVGKTRLLEELASRSRAAGHTVLLGACVQFGDFALPYVPIVDALHALEASPDGARLLRAEAARRPVLTRLLPHLIEAGDVVRPGHELAEGLAQVQLFEALHGIVVALAETAPVLFVIEDLHWADRSTRDLIAFLARTLRSGRVALIVSYRSEDVNRRHPLRPLLAELARRADVERIDVSGFSHAEVAELLHNTIDGPIEPQLLERVFARSEGNAFFAEELLRASARPHQNALPEALVDVLLTRVEALHEDSRRTLRLAAVAGRRSTHDLLVEAADADPDQTEDALRDAVEAGLLVNIDDAYAFRHALLQEAVYGDLLPGERIRLHARFAELLEQRHAAEGAASEVSMAELAHHRLASHDFPRAFVALVAAADEAEEVAAPAEALRHLEQALGIIGEVDATADRFGLLVRATEAAAASGESGRAVTHAAAAVIAADANGDLHQRAERRERLARAQLEVDQPAAATAAQAVEMLKGTAPSKVRARSLATYGRTLLSTDPVLAETLLSESIEVAEAVGADAIAADALVTRALMVTRGLIPGDAAELLALAVERASAAPDGLATELRTRRFQSVQLLENGRIADALTVARQGVQLSERAGLSWSSYGLDLQLIRGWALSANGEWDDVLRASLHAAYAPTSPGRVLATQALAVLVARGDPTADDLLRQLRGTGDVWGELQLDMCEVDLLLQRDDPEAALAIVEGALSARGEHYAGETEGVLLSARAAMASAALAIRARAAGDLRKAAALAETAAAHVELAQTHAAACRPSRPPAVWMWVLWTIAEAARATGSPATPEWAAVVAEADRAGRVENAAAARLRLAESALDSGDRGAETVAVLRAALATAQRLGAEPLILRAHDLARRARLEAELGLPPALASATKNLALTAREAEVLRLLTDGLTNRQIGRALFISDKTASVHVSNILGKLGATTRTEAAALARQQGLLAG